MFPSTLVTGAMEDVLRKGGDTWRYPWTAHPDYLGPGSPQQRYMARRAELVTGAPDPATPSAAPAPQPPATANAVAAATAAAAGNKSAGTQDVEYPNFSVPTARTGVDAVLSQPAFRPLVQRSAFVGMPEMRAAVPGVPELPDAQRGLFSPELEGQLAALQDEATPLLRSTGIVDRLRGRQAMRMRQRLIEGAVAQAGAKIGAFNANANLLGANASMLGAQSSALRAANEVPLAVLHAGVQQRGQDLTAGVTQRGQDLSYDADLRRVNMTGAVAQMNDATQRYGIDETQATHRLAAEYGLAPHLPTIAAKTRENALIQVGDYDMLGKITTATHPQAPRNPVVHDLPTGGVVVIGADGAPKFYNPKDMEAQRLIGERDAKRAAEIARRAQEGK